MSPKFTDLKKDSPDGLCESQETINIFSGVIWATACQAVTAFTCLVRRDIFLEAVLEWMAPS